MTLQTRLVVSFSILLLVVIATVGFVASRSVESVLITQIDNALLRFDDRGRLSAIPPEGIRLPVGAEEFLRPVAEVLIDAGGIVVGERPSGFIDDPDALSDVTALPEESGLVYLDSFDGSGLVTNGSHSWAS